MVYHAATDTSSLTQFLNFCLKCICICLWALEAYIYKMFMISVDPCIVIYGDWGIHRDHFEVRYGDILPYI